jgi:hypothetical protein
MKKITISLFLIIYSWISFGQGISQNNPTKFLCNAPTSRPTGLNNYVIVVDTCNGKNYYYKSANNRIEVVLQRGVRDTVQSIVINQGLNGTNGRDGRDGTNGTNGFNGAQGIQGIQGIPGVKGDKGDTGASGGGTSSFAGIVSTQAELFARITSNQSAILTNDIGLTSPLNFQKSINNRSGRVVLNLNGYALYDASASGLPYVVGRIASDQNEALNVMQSVGVVIRDGAIIGKNNGQGIGIDLAATYGSVIQSVDFKGFKEGLHLRFCLMTLVANCMTTSITSEPFIADMGNWSGANNSNSQSNSTRFEQCRVFSNDGAFSCFSAYAASGMVWEQCIAEGGNPKYDYYIDGKNSTVVKDGLIHMSHAENTPTLAAIYVSMYDAYFRVQGFFDQYPATLFSMNSTGGNSKWYISDVDYWPLGSKLEGNTGVWDIDGIEWGNGFDPFSDTTWKGTRNGSVKLQRWGNGADKHPYTRTTPAWEINGKNY